MADGQQRLPPNKRARLVGDWTSEDIIGLLEENHRLRLELASLQGKLQHSMNVSDFKHLLQKTLHSVERKQMVRDNWVTTGQPPVCMGCSSCHSGSSLPGHQDYPLGYGRQAEDMLNGWITGQRTAVCNPHMLKGHWSSSSSGLPQYPEPIHQSASGMNVLPTYMGTSGVPPASLPVLPYIVKVQSLADMQDENREESNSGFDNVKDAVETAAAGDAEETATAGDAVETSTAGPLQDSQNNVHEKPDLPDSPDPTAEADNNNVSNETDEEASLGSGSGNDDGDAAQTLAEDSSVDTVPYPTAWESQENHKEADETCNDPVSPDNSQDAEPGRRSRRKPSEEEMMELYPGSGVLIEKEKFLEATMTCTYTRMTVHLMRALFTREEMATSSLTGQSKNPEYTRRLLDQMKVGAIVDAVQATFSDATTRTLTRQLISTTLCRIRKSLRGRETGQQW